jgi:hypothetical protein
MAALGSEKWCQRTWLSVKVTANSRGDSSVSSNAKSTTLRRTSSGMRFQTCFGLGDWSCKPASVIPPKISGVQKPNFLSKIFEEIFDEDSTI